MAAKKRSIPRTGTSETPNITNQRPETKKRKAKLEPLAELTTQAALAGRVGEIWNTPEEDEAWAHLKDLN